jgi:bacteriorhodopsin
MDTSSWLWVGTIGMAVGSLLLALLATTLRKEDRHHATVAVGITAVAASSYYAMVHGFGNLDMMGMTLQSARYIDWLITTPLLLLSLCLVGLPSKVKGRAWTIATLVFLDVYMIVTGFLGALADANTKWMWYVASSVALLLIAYVLYVTIMKTVRMVGGKDLTKLYTTLAVYLSVLWVAYPVVWLLGTTGQNKISFNTENAVYAVLDLLAKVGFGLLLVWNVKKLSDKAHAKTDETTVDTLAK